MTAEPMKAVRLHRYGPPEDALIYEDVPKPVVGQGMVLVRNEAAGINFADIEQRRNTYPYPLPLPVVLGAEFAGSVEAVGAGVAGIALGERVFGFTTGPQLGGYAQYVAADVADLHPIPAGLGYADSTALLAQGLTAYFLLRDGVQLRDGDSVLILAAAGGLGSLAVQLAKILGAHQVIGAASTPEKRQLVSDLGADDTIDYTQPGWSAQVLEITGGRGVDAVLANVGGDSFTEALGSLAPLGRLRAFGTADAQTPVIDFAAELGAGRLSANQNVGFFSIQSYLTDSQQSAVTSALAVLAEHVVEGRLRIPQGLRIPLARASHAHRLIEDRQTAGKAVLVPWPDSPPR